MTREVLQNGYVKMTSKKGIVDSRFGSTHYTVICSAENEQYFAEVEGEEQNG